MAAGIARSCSARAADKDELAEQEAILDIYKSALGMV